MQNIYKHALVIGKFYPPHLGHCFLIESASTFAQHVSVIVMASHEEQLDLNPRVTWLREYFKQYPKVKITGVWDDLPVDYESEEIWQAQVDLMKVGLDELRGYPNDIPAVDAVFSSEEYGYKLATYFDAAPVVVDVEREMIPVSATAIRQNLRKNWQYLPHNVQSDLCHRIVIVGGESSGKTTLAKAITQKLNETQPLTSYVGEYGREYTLLKLKVMQADAYKKGLTPPTVFDCEWHSQEFMHIAEIQTRREQEAAEKGLPFTIYDTDAFATQLWHERYMGSHSAELEQFVQHLPKRSLYILPSIEDVPFEQDGLRDGEQIRHQMHQAFRDALIAMAPNVPFIEVKGSVSERVEQSISAILQLKHPFESME